MELVTISNGNADDKAYCRVLDSIASTDTCFNRIFDYGDTGVGSCDKDIPESNRETFLSFRVSSDNNAAPLENTIRKEENLVGGGVSIAQEECLENVAQEHGADQIIGIDAVPPTTSASAVLSPRKTICMLILLCSTNLCLAMSASLVAPYFPREVVLKGGNVAMVGLVMSSYDAVRFILAPFLGIYVNKIGIRFLLVSGPFIAAWCIILFGLLGKAPANTWFFILAAATRMMSGLGAIMYGVTTISIQPILFKEHFGFAFSILRSVSITGAIIGPAGGGLLYSAGGYPLPFYVTGVTSLVVALVQALVTPNLSHVATTSEQFDENLTRQQGSDAVAADQEVLKKATLFTVFIDRRMFVCFFVNVTIGFVAMFYNSSISLHVLPLVGSVSRVGYIMLITGLSDVLTAPLAGWLLDRFISAEFATVLYFFLSTISLLLVGPSPLLPFFHKSLPLVICGMVCMGIGTAIGYPSLYKLAHKRAFASGYAKNPQTYSVLTGCILTCTTFGGFLGPLISGFLQSVVGFSWAYTFVAIFGLISAFVIIGLNFLTLYAFLSKSVCKRK